MSAIPLSPRITGRGEEAPAVPSSRGCGRQRRAPSGPAPASDLGLYMRTVYCWHGPAPLTRTANQIQMAKQHAKENVEYFGPVFSTRAIAPPWKTPRVRRQLSREQRPPDLRLPETGFLRLPEVLAVFPVSRSRWWAGVREGKFPVAVKLGPNTTAWRAEDIRRLINECNSSTTSRT